MAPLAVGRGSERATPFRRICIYCGANNGMNASYVEAARDLGERLAKKGIGVVYGGGRVGLMGAVADGALAAGGEVIGIIPEKLRAAEVAHHGLSELFVVDSMHARKTMMATLSDAFITLPGGFGTLEETFEVITWSQLNYHRKPVGLLNVKGYYDLLLRFFEHMVGEGLVRPEHRAFVVSAEDPDALLELLARAEVPVSTFRIEKT